MEQCPGNQIQINMKTLTYYNRNNGGKRLKCMILVLLLTGWAATAQTIPDITVWYPVYPVLEGKTHNPVARINIRSLSSGQPLEEIVMRVEEKQGKNSIAEVQVYYTDNDSVFTTGHLFASVEAGKTVRLKNSLSLQKGNNYLWISLQPDKRISVEDRLAVNVNSVVIDGRQHKIQQQNPHVLRTGIALREHGEEGVDTYRIPGLVTTNQGTLIAVYDIRYNNAADLQENIDIGISRSVDGGETWEPMQVIMDRGTWGGFSEDANGVGDPSILVDRTTGAIWVAGLWTHGYPGERAWTASGPGMSPKETGQFLLVKSEDDGLTWSEPINITEQIKDPSWTLLLQGPGRGITMENGTLVFPAQYKDEEGMPYATIIYSKDHGKTWHIGTGAKSNTTEAQVVQLSNGSLMLNMRDNRGGTRSVYITEDMGQTWKAHPTSRKALIEPVSMASIISHEYNGKNFLIFSNPNSTEGRHHMTIKLSKDVGMTWPEEYQLLLDEGAGRGYSCLTSIDENTIGILYEGSQADLIFQKIPLEDLFRATN